MKKIDVDIATMAAKAAEIAAPVFEQEGWTWFGFHTPSVGEINETYLKLAHPVLKGASRSVSGGRLCVRVMHDEDGEPEGISFGIELATVWE